MCIYSIKETCFSQKKQKWICSILELNSLIVLIRPMNHKSPHTQTEMIWQFGTEVLHYFPSTWSI